MSSTILLPSSTGSQPHEQLHGSFRLLSSDSHAGTTFHQAMLPHVQCRLRKQQARHIKHIQACAQLTQLCYGLACCSSTPWASGVGRHRDMSAIELCALWGVSNRGLVVRPEDT